MNKRMSDGTKCCVMLLAQSASGDHPQRGTTNDSGDKRVKMQAIH